MNDQTAGVDALGVVFGGSGNGEQIAANKVSGIRAALIWNESTALLARQHNDANVCAIGARQHTLDDAIHLIDLFLAEPFSKEERHARRIAQLAEFEATGAIAGHPIDDRPRPERARGAFDPSDRAAVPPQLRRPAAARPRARRAGSRPARQTSTAAS